MHHSLAVEHDDDEKEDPVVDDGPPASSWTKFSSLSCLSLVELSEATFTRSSLSDVLLFIWLGGTLRSQIEGYTRLIIFWKFS